MTRGVHDPDSPGRPVRRPANTEYDLAVAKGGPVEVLKRAGLDMTSPAPYRALINKFSRTLDEVEKLMAT